MLKRGLSILLTAVMLLSCLPAAALAASDPTPSDPPALSLPASGEEGDALPEAETSEDTAAPCGENLTWVYDRESKTLTITGAGPMTDFKTVKSVPWAAYIAEIEQVVIEDGATSVGSRAFTYAESLQSVTLPDTLTALGAYAFYQCTALQTVELPDSVASLGFKSFYGCTALTEINIPLGWTSCPTVGTAVNANYCGHIFEGCTSLTDITVPDGMTALPAFAFAFCDTLQSITLPDTVAEIGYQAFTDCVNLREINIPAGWTSCPSVAADGTLNTRYCGSIFSNCPSLTTVTVPEGMTTLPAYAFSNCNYLRSVELPESLTELPHCAFYNCTQLALIQLPANTRVIGTYAFGNCKNVQSVNLPVSVEQIDDNAFDGCITSAIHYGGNAEQWQYITISDQGNDILGQVEIIYEQVIDTTYRIVRPTSLGSCFYSSPTSVSFNNFYGGFCDNTGNEKVLDVNDAFFGPNAYNIYVSIPKDSYITLRFPNVVYFNNDTYLYMKTAGINQERADLYAVLSNGDLEFLQTLTENTESHVYRLKDPGSGVVGLKVVGKDLDGGSPGFDVAELYLLTHESELPSDYHSNTTVSLTRDSVSYNLLEETQTFTWEKGEAATLIVTPDWQDREPGTIQLVQGGRVVLENQGGTFVDINPGLLFAPLENIYVYLVDADNNIVESLKLKLELEISSSSRLTASTRTMTLTVYENRADNGAKADDYVLSEGAAVTMNGTTYTTNSSGSVTVPTLSSGTITVSKDGYVSRTLTIAHLQISRSIYLQPQPASGEAGGPVISAVWMGDKDVLHQSQSMAILWNERVALRAEVSWGDGGEGTIALVQGDKRLNFTGDTLYTVLGDTFNLNKTVYIQATDGQGRYTRKSLEFEDGKAVGSYDWLKGFSVNLGTSFADVTLSEGIKPSFFAGTRLSAGITTPIPFSASVDENGKVYIAIGIEPISWEWKNNEEGLQTKSFVKKLKTTGVFDTTDLEKNWNKFKNFQQTYDSLVKQIKGDWGFSADFVVLGYAEGYWDAEDGLTLLDSGLIVNPYVKVGYDLPFMLGPVPLFFEAIFIADIKGALELYLVETEKAIRADGSISGSISASAGVGAGAKNVLYAAGGLTGTLYPDAEWKYRKPTTFTLDAEISAYAKGGFLCFEVKHTWPLARATWISLGGSKSADSYLSLNGFYDQDRYTRKDLSYLDSGSQFTGNMTDALSTLGADGLPVAAQTLKTNLYRESTPQYLHFGDGTALAVWLDGADSSINSTQLYYAYYDGTSWSDPALVYADGTMDYAPQLKLINGTPWLVWQNATAAFDNNAGQEQIIPYFDISAASFTPGSGFGTPAAFVQDNLDTLPVVAGDSDGTVYVAWVNNSANDWFGSGENSILYTAYAEGKWSEIQTAYTGLSAVNSLAADGNGGLQLAWCVDSGDSAVLYENGQKVTQADGSTYNPVYVGHTLYWAQGGGITWKGNTAESSLAGASRFQLLTDGESLAALYTTSNGLYATLNLSYYNEELNQWCEPVALTGGTDFIGAFSGAMLADGTVEVLVNRQQVTGDMEADDPYGTSRLELLTLAPRCDLTMGELVYNLDEYSAGSPIELFFNLTNSGSQSIDAATITVTDEAGQQLSSILYDDLLVPGQTASVSTYFTVPADGAAQTVTVTVTPDELTDANLADNSQTAELAFEDVGIEECRFGRNGAGQDVISADVVNYGYHVRQPLVAELRVGSVQGDLLATADVAALEPLALTTVSFAVEADTAKVYYVVLRDSGDAFTANDADFAVVPADAPFAIIGNVDAGSIQLHLSNETAGTCLAALYDSDGRMLTAASQEVEAEAGELTLSFPDCEGEPATVKVFFLDDTQAPVYPQVEGVV